MYPEAVMGRQHGALHMRSTVCLGSAAALLRGCNGCLIPNDSFAVVIEDALREEVSHPERLDPP